VAPPKAVAPGDTPVTPAAGRPLNISGFRFDRYGVRVPAVVVSPWIEKGVIDGRTYDHASIPATVAARFGLETMTERDAAAETLLPLLTRREARTDCPANIGPQLPARFDPTGEWSAGQSDGHRLTFRIGWDHKPAGIIRATATDTGKGIFGAEGDPTTGDGWPGIVRDGWFLLGVQWPHSVYKSYIARFDNATGRLAGYTWQACNSGNFATWMSDNEFPLARFEEPPLAGVLTAFDPAGEWTIVQSNTYHAKVKITSSTGGRIRGTATGSGSTGDVRGFVFYGHFLFEIAWPNNMTGLYGGYLELVNKSPKYLFQLVGHTWSGGSHATWLSDKKWDVADVDVRLIPFSL
jgi:hypothetical protein